VAPRYWRRKSFGALCRLQYLGATAPHPRRLSASEMWTVSVGGLKDYAFHSLSNDGCHPACKETVRNTK